MINSGSETIHVLVATIVRKADVGIDLILIASIFFNFLQHRYTAVKLEWSSILRHLPNNYVHWALLVSLGLEI